MFTMERKFELQGMSDAQLVRVARILQLTKAAHEWDEECRYVTLILTERDLVNPLRP